MHPLLQELDDQKDICIMQDRPKVKPHIEKLVVEVDTRFGMSNNAVNWSTVGDIGI